MFLFVLLAIPLFIFLIYSTVKDEKNPLKKRMTALSGLVFLSLMLSIFFGLFGFEYIQRYQQQQLNSNVGGACPAHYPYEWAVLASGAVGLITLIYMLVVFLRRRMTKAAIYTFLCGVVFAGIVVWCFFATVFCLTG